VQHLHRLPQFNFFRSPMCRVAGLKTCLALPISPGEQSDEVFGAVVLFTTEELEPRQEIVEPLMDKYAAYGWLCCSLVCGAHGQVRAAYAHNRCTT
jgi:hypothetical protein